MLVSRRELIKLLGACVATGSLNVSALAQGPPRPVRLPLDEFVENAVLLAALRRGIRQMKKRKPSDPLSWFFQAAIHGVTPDAVAQALNQDSGVEHVFQKRYWNQCPHDGENSANFLPWHRGYTYYFEKILRMHAEIDEFALPYWHYDNLKKPDNRKFPRALGIKHLDGNLNNEDPENINPLYHAERDFYFCEYEHPFALGLPLLELTESAVDTRPSLSSKVFFGETETEGLGGGIADEDPTTRGLLESYPHDQIHRAVGGIILKVIDGKEVPTVGAMATPPTAGFDPIFPLHHSNIDRLWAFWACTPGNQWGKLPSSYWFNERPWFFYDTDGRVVNEPRKSYFDHRALGIRFKGEDESCKPLTLPDVEKMQVELIAKRVQQLESLAIHKANFGAIPATRTVVTLPANAIQSLRNPANAVRDAIAANRTNQRMVARILDVNLGLVRATGFDVHITDKPKTDLDRTAPSFVGSIAVFCHAGHSQHTAGGEMAMPNGHAAMMDAHGHSTGGESQSFDVTKAIAAIKDENFDQLSMVLVPYPLLAVPGKDTMILNNNEYLTAGGVDFLRMELN